MSQQRQALVVGISEYVIKREFGELKGASIDAKDINEILKNRGGFFPIKRLPKNLSDERDAQSKPKYANQNLVAQEDLQDEIESFFKSDGNTIPDIALFYFSGHGYRDSQRKCYLCASNSTTTDIETMISLDWLGELINDCPVKQQVIWLDCCYSGELLNTINHEQEGINRFLITACDRDETAIEDSTKGGSLTQLLLEGLKVESHGENCQIVDSQQLEQWIKRKIEKLSIEQQPQIYQDLNTKIYLTVKGKIAGVDLEDHGRDPYKSLEFFNENDARIFYGRDEETQSLIEDLHKNKFVAVTGASGVGKSSLLRAGLLYRLKKEERSKNWGYIELIDLKTEPLSRLSTAINEYINSHTNPPVSQEGEKDPKKLVDKLAIASNSNPIVLVIDQFGECFDPDNNAERDYFFRLLTELIQRDKLLLYLVIGMRSHFFVNDLKEKNITIYNALYPKEIEFLKEEKLKDAIEKPADRVGLKIDEELQIEIFSDFEQSSALMEYNLAELTKYHKDWAIKNQKDWYFYPITLNAYREFQKIVKPLNSLGHQCYDALSVTEKPIAKYILLKLIRININENKNKPKPRTRTSDQLACLRFSSDTIIGYVRKKLADGRLITIDADSSEKIKFSLSHKDLITQWGDFGSWITDHQEDIISVCDLEQKAESWKSSGQKKELLSNHDLKNYDQKKEGILFLLNQLTKDFISESKKQAERKNKILWTIIVIFVIAVFGGIFLIVAQKNKIQKQTIGSSGLLKDFNTDTNTDIEESITVGSNLKQYDEGFNTGFSPEEKSQIISSLYDTIIGRSDQRFRMTNRSSFPDKINRVGVSPDNSYIALATKEKIIFINNLGNSNNPDNSTNKAKKEQSFSTFDFTSDGKRLSLKPDINSSTPTRSFESYPTIKIEVNEVAQYQLLQKDVVKSVVFSPDEKAIAIGSKSEIVLWQCEDSNLKLSKCIFESDNGNLIKITLHTDDWVNSVSFNFDGKMLAAATLGKIIIWRCKDSNQKVSSCAMGDLQSYTLHLKDKARWINSVTFAPSKYNLLAFADEEGFVQVWQLDNKADSDELSLKQLMIENVNKEKQDRSPVNQVSFGIQECFVDKNTEPDHRIVKLAAASKENIKIWTKEDKSSENFKSSTNNFQHERWAKQGGANINTLSFSPDGKRLASGGQDKIVKIWNIKDETCLGKSDSIEQSKNNRQPASNQSNGLIQTLLLEGDAIDINFYGDSDKNPESNPYRFVSASYKDRGIVKLWKEIKIGESIGLNTLQFQIRSSNKNNNDANESTNSLPLFIKSFSYDVSNVFLSTDGCQVAAIQDSPQSALSVWNDQSSMCNKSDKSDKSLVVQQTPGQTTGQEFRPFLQICRHERSAFGRSCLTSSDLEPNIFVEKLHEFLYSKTLSDIRYTRFLPHQAEQFKQIYNNTLGLDMGLDQYLSIISNKFFKSESEFLRVAIIFQKSKTNPYQQQIRLYDIPVDELSPPPSQEKFPEYENKEIRIDSEELNLDGNRKIFPGLDLLSPTNGQLLLSPDGAFLATLSEFKDCNNFQQISIWKLDVQPPRESHPNNNQPKCSDLSTNNSEYRSFGFSTDSNFFAFLKEDKHENEIRNEEKKSKLVIRKKDTTNTQFNISIPALEPALENDPKAFAFDPNNKNTLAILRLEEDSEKVKLLKISKVNLKNLENSPQDIDPIPCDDDASLIQYPTPTNTSTPAPTNTSERDLAVACRSIIYLFKFNSNKLTIKNILPHGAKVAKFSFNDTRLISLDTDKKLYYWDFKDKNNASEQFYLKLNKFACKILPNNKNCSNTDNQKKDYISDILSKISHLF